jgi:hypothetical protein
MTGSNYSLDGLRKLREILKKLLKGNTQPQLQPELIALRRKESFRKKQ